MIVIINIIIYLWIISLSGRQQIHFLSGLRSSPHLLAEKQKVEALRELYDSTRDRIHKDNNSSRQSGRNTNIHGSVSGYVSRSPQVPLTGGVGSTTVWQHSMDLDHWIVWGDPHDGKSEDVMLRLFVMLSAWLTMIRVIVPEGYSEGIVLLYINY